MKVGELDHIGVGHETVAAIDILQGQDTMCVILEVDGFFIGTRGVGSAIAGNGLFVPVIKDLDDRLVTGLTLHLGGNPTIGGVLDKDEGIFLLSFTHDDVDLASFWYVTVLTGVSRKRGGLCVCVLVNH